MKRLVIGIYILMLTGCGTHASQVRLEPLQKAYSKLNVKVFVDPVVIVANLDPPTSRMFCRFEYDGSDVPQLTADEFTYLYYNNQKDPRFVKYQESISRVTALAEARSRCEGKAVTIETFDMKSKEVRKNILYVGRKEITDQKQLTQKMGEALVGVGFRSAQSVRDSDYIVRAAISEIHFGETGNSSDTTSLALFGYLGGRRVEEYGAKVAMDVSLIEESTGRYIATVPVRSISTNEFVTDAIVQKTIHSFDIEKEYAMPMIHVAIEKGFREASIMLREKIHE